MPEPTDKPAEPRWERAAAPVLVGAALLVLAAPLADPSQQIAARDAGRMLYPLKHFLADELAQGRLPSWNPFVGLGEPLVASVVAGALDPLNLLGVALPFGWGFKAMHLACYLAGALGVWLWARGRQLSRSAAAAAALAFVLSGYATGIANNLIYLRGLTFGALFVAAFDRAARAGGAKGLGTAALAWALILWGGEPQSWLVSFPFALVLALAEPGADRRVVLHRAALVGLLGTMLSAPVLLPAALEFPRTDRAMLGEAAIAPQWWFAPSRVVELFFPALLQSGEGANPVYQALFAAGRPMPWVPSQYLGAGVLLLAACGARGRGGGAALGLTLALLWLATGPALGADRLGSAIPVWRSFQYPEKLLGWVALGASMLAALGLERLRSGLSRPERWAAAAGALALATVGVGVLAHSFGGSLPPEAAAALRANLVRGSMQAATVLALGSAALLVLRRRLPALALGLAALAGADLLAVHSLRPALLPASVLEVKSPLADWIRTNDPLARVATPFEYSEQGPMPAAAQYAFWSRTLVPLWNVEARVGNMGWYGGLASGRYRVLREVGRDGLRYLEAAAAHGAGYVVVPGAPENMGRLGVEAKDVAATDPTVPASLVRVAHRPFAYLVQQPEKADAEVALAGVLAPGFAAGGRTFVETTEPVPAACDGEGEVVSACDTPTRCSLAVKSPCPRLLVVNLPPAPGWTFRLDGREVEPMTANFLASSFRVPQGAHRVALDYSTPGLSVGSTLALLGFGVVAAAALRERRKPAARPGPSTPAC